MVFRIGDGVTRGEIDNRTKDRVAGRIWLKGCKNPVHLNLEGNCLRDIAGTLFQFECTAPETIERLSGLHDTQDGCVGDITASRKVRALSLPVEEAYEMNRKEKDVPEVKANCLYVEWYSTTNGRVVLETVHFKTTFISEPAWIMTADEAQIQRTHNLLAFEGFLEDAEIAIEEQRSNWSPDDDKNMDEFEWEKFLRESDKRTEKYSKLLDKYRGHPASDRIIAREMGWDRLDDLLDAEERNLLTPDLDSIEDYPPLELDASTEGVDWIRTDDGDIRHPLSHRAAELSHTVWKTCDELGLARGDARDNDAGEMIFQIQMLAAKLAGALNSLGYREEVDGGFLVAYLKRAIQYFNPAMIAIGALEQRCRIPAPRLKVFKKELFEIRDAILILMKKYRG